MLDKHARAIPSAILVLAKNEERKSLYHINDCCSKPTRVTFENTQWCSDILCKCDMPFGNI